MKYVIFDLDGTVADTKEGVTKSVQYSLIHFGIDVENLDELEKFIGPPLQHSYEEFYDFSEEKAAEAVKQYRVYYNDKGLLQCYIYPGIEKLIKKLHENGIRVILGTSKPEVYAKRILEHFGLAEYFDFIAGSTMTTERTKKVDVLKYAIENIKKIDNLESFNYQEAYMVGDRKFDYIGATELGIPCILVEFGYGSHDELVGCGPEKIVKTVEELTDFLETNM